MKNNENNPRIIFGLGSKAALVSVAGLILVSVILSIVFFQSNKQSVLDELRIRSFTLASNLAYNSSYPVVAGDKATLLNLIKGVVREKDIVEVTILDSGKQILVTTDSARLKKSNPYELPSKLSDPDWIPTSKDDSYLAAAPIEIETRKALEDESVFFEPLLERSSQDSTKAGKPEGETVGYVVLEVTLVNLKEQFATLFQRVLVITLLIVIFGGALTAIAVNKTVKPLRDLANATTDIALGKFGKTIDVPRLDEIGDLAQAFNEMSLKLKRTKDDLNTLNKQLEKRVAESTKELNEKYMEVQDALETVQRSDSSKDDFLAFVSHEVRNPLTTIQLYSEMLLRGYESFDASKEDFLHSVISNCERLTRLLDEVLDWVKLESGNMRFQIEEFNIVDLIEEVISSLKANLAEKNIHCYGNYLDGTIMVKSDRDKLFQVISNLLFNAIKFSHEDDEITVNTNDQGQFVEVFVEDRGKGIREEDLPNLFGKFAQFDKQGAGLGGSGLGLAISNALVEQLGGKIWAESTYGQGTKITFQVLADASVLAQSNDQ